MFKTACSSVACLALFTASALSADVVTRSPEQAGASAAVPDYAHAKPMPLPTPKLTPQAAQSLLSGAGKPVPNLGPAVTVPGSVGSGVPHPVRVAPAKVLSNDTPAGGGLSSQDYGSAALPYTDQRVDGYGAYQSGFYPYRAAGKLFFQISGSYYVCSASLIKPGVVVTAAHCVANWGQNQFYSNWQFIPGYYNGSAPFGTWNATYAIAPTAYVRGTDSCAQAGVVCSDDVALLVLQSGGDGSQVGASTGWLGYSYNGAQYVNSTVLLNQLGYPVSLDGGELMQNNAAQGTINASYSNNTVFGSLMTGGSSGGPFVANLGEQPANSGPFGSRPGRNLVIGVTSWGYTSETVKAQGGSFFTSNNITNLINYVCSNSPNKC